MAISQPSIDKAINIISQIYSPLSAQTQKDLAEAVQWEHYTKSHLLVKEGQYSDKTFFIIEGGGRAYYLKDGRDITDWFAFEQEFISSINSYFLHSPSPCNIEIFPNTSLLVISRSTMIQLCDKHHDFERLCRIVVTHTLLKLQQKVISSQFESAQQRYDNLIKIRPDITQRVLLGHIASYLGISLETLSRIRNPKNRI